MNSVATDRALYPALDAPQNGGRYILPTYTREACGSGPEKVFFVSGRLVQLLGDELPDTLHDRETREPDDPLGLAHALAHDLLSTERHVESEGTHRTFSGHGTERMLERALTPLCGPQIRKGYEPS
jgi:hypothetical protein